jgi:hypothetical protein
MIRWDLAYGLVAIVLLACAVISGGPVIVALVAVFSVIALAGAAARRLARLVRRWRSRLDAQIDADWPRFI